MNYTPGDILRSINERISYYEDHHDMTVHDVCIEGDEVVIDYTLPSGNQFAESYTDEGKHD